MLNVLFAVSAATIAFALLHDGEGITTSLTLERWAAEAKSDTCEVLFVGPSYTKWQVLPWVFASETKRLKKPMKACTFGIAGLRGLELRMHVDKML